MNNAPIYDRNKPKPSIFTMPQQPQPNKATTPQQPKSEPPKSQSKPPAEIDMFLNMARKVTANAVNEL